MIRLQLYRAWPWLVLAMTLILAACNNGGAGGSGAGGSGGPGY